MPKPLATLCFELARHAQDAGHTKLAYILRMAGGEALDCRAVITELNQKIGSWDWDTDKNLGFLDPVAAAMLGFDAIIACRGITPEQILAKIHPDELRQMQVSLSQAVLAGGPFEFLFRVVPGDTILPVRMTGHVVLDEVGRLVRMAGLLYDVTDKPVAAENRAEA